MRNLNTPPPPPPPRAHSCAEALQGDACLTRRVPAVRELGAAGAASHRGRPSDGAQRLSGVSVRQTVSTDAHSASHTPGDLAPGREGFLPNWMEL